MSVRAFARAVNVTPGYISRVVAGERWPLPWRLRQWADTLGLNGQDRQDFILTAQIESAPEELREHVFDLRRKSARTRSR
jgi:hypothetical protein